MLYESIYSHPGVAHLNDLLRQQSENAYLNTKNPWILKCSADFLDFLIFLMLDGFEVVWLSISTSWLDFLPGVGSRSIWAGISNVFRFFSSYAVHVPTLCHWNLGRYAFPGAGTLLEL